MSERDASPRRKGNHKANVISISSSANRLGGILSGGGMNLRPNSRTETQSVPTLKTAREPFHLEFLQELFRETAPDGGVFGRMFLVPPSDENDEAFQQILAGYASQYRLTLPVVRHLVYQLATVYFDTKRTENAMERLSQTYFKSEPAKWLRLHAGFVTQRSGLHQASQQIIKTLQHFEQKAAEESFDRTATPSTLAAAPLKRDEHGNRVEEYRFWNLYKFSVDPDDTINEAVEVVCYTDGTAESTQTVRLKDFMSGEFMKPEYGLGEQFRRLIRQYPHPLHHPFDPSRIKPF
jgi:hypothetical protein